MNTQSDTFGMNGCLLTQVHTCHLSDTGEFGESE